MLQFIKSVARRAGLYRQARWVKRHVMDRAELRAFREERAFYSRLLSPGALCFDVGANFGWKSEVLSSLGCRVIAFEPQESCLAEIRARVRRSQVTPVHAVLGAEPGHAVLHVRKEPTASSLLPSWQGDVVDTVSVPMTTLDAAIAQWQTPAYCKIDVEGYELEVLKGLTRPIQLVSFEYHVRDSGIGDALACLERLKKLSGPRDLRVNVTPAEQMQFIQPDWWTYASFTTWFPNEIRNVPGCEYGDIFVSLVAEA